MTQSHTVGHTVPTFQLPDETGQVRQLDDLHGENGLLLVFVRGTWCPQCVQTLYYVGRYANAITELGVNIAVVAIDEAENLNTFKISAPVPINFPLLADPDQTIHILYEIAVKETYFLLDRGNRVQEHFFDPDGHGRPSPRILTDSIRTHLIPQTA